MVVTLERNRIIAKIARNVHLATIVTRERNRIGVKLAAMRFKQFVSLSAFCSKTMT